MNKGMVLVFFFALIIVFFYKYVYFQVEYIIESSIHIESHKFFWNHSVRKCDIFLIHKDNIWFLSKKDFWTIRPVFKLHFANIQASIFDQRQPRSLGIIFKYSFEYKQTVYPDTVHSIRDTMQYETNIYRITFVLF